MGEPPSGLQAKEKQAAQGSLFFGSPVWFLNAKISRWHVCVSEAWTCQAGKPSDHLVGVTYRRYRKHKKARATVSGVGQEGCWSLASPPPAHLLLGIQLCPTPGGEQRQFWDSSPRSPGYGLGTSVQARIGAWPALPLYLVRLSLMVQCLV